MNKVHYEQEESGRSVIGLECPKSDIRTINLYNKCRDYPSRCPITSYARDMNPVL